MCREGAQAEAAQATLQAQLQTVQAELATVRALVVERDHAVGYLEAANQALEEASVQQKGRKRERGVSGVQQTAQVPAEVPALEVVVVPEEIKSDD